eukprot:TRINITY_DN18767_c0_g1_i1.p1 TRINITY_DN18767_c0_g1~~TRINITY_DN18767_c0_g1_i1.p1  ORF type:complete len:324 (+),score=56.93 TRINITY_DN18767_c0_g1_i1:42-1013(+)
MFAAWMQGAAQPAAPTGRRSCGNYNRESPAPPPGLQPLMARGQKARDEQCLIGVKIQPSVMAAGCGKRKVTGKSSGTVVAESIISPRDAFPSRGPRGGYSATPSAQRNAPLGTGSAAADQAGRRKVDGCGGGVSDVASPFSPRDHYPPASGKRRLDASDAGDTVTRVINPPRSGAVIPKSRRTQPDRCKLRGGVPVHKPEPKAETANHPHQVDTHRRHYAVRNSGTLRAEPERSVVECTRQLDQLRTTLRHARAAPHQHRRVEDAPQAAERGAFGQRRSKGAFSPGPPDAPSILKAGLHAEPPGGGCVRNIKIGKPMSEVWEP